MITLLTDFGLQDVYVGVMKGVIAAVAPQVSIVDLTHQIPPQDLLSARFALLSAYSYFPAGTVHVAVVDPGVGSQRRGVAVQFAGGFLVGADNGLFSGVLSRTKAISAVELNNPDYWRTKSPSTTFHGRDIFAFVGAHLANGVDLKELGTAISVDSLVQLSILEIIVQKDRIVGCIQYIDVFGNLITNIPSNYISSNSQIFIKQQLITLGKTYSDGKDGELIGLIGSHSYLEIAVNCGNAQKKLGVRVGEEVFVNSSKL